MSAMKLSPIQARKDNDRARVSSQSRSSSHSSELPAGSSFDSSVTTSSFSMKLPARTPHRLTALDEQPSLSLDADGIPMGVEMMDRKLRHDVLPPTKATRTNEPTEVSSCPTAKRTRMFLTLTILAMLLVAAGTCAWLLTSDQARAAQDDMNSLTAPTDLSPSGLTAPMPSPIPTIPPIIFVVASSSIVLDGFGPPTSFTTSHVTAFAQGIVASSSGLLTSPSEVTHVVASAATSSRRALLGQREAISVAFSVELNLKSAGYHGAAGGNALAAAASALATLASSLESSMNTTTRDGGEAGFFACFVTAMTTLSLNVTGIRVDVEATLSSIRQLADSAVVTSAAGSPHPTSQPTHSLPPTLIPLPEPTLPPTVAPTISPTVKPSSSPTLPPTLIPTNVPTMLWVPREDPKLVAWYPLDSNFNDDSPSTVHGTWHLSGKLASMYANYPNASAPTSPADAGFFQTSGHPSAGGWYGPTSEIVNDNMVVATTSALTGASSTDFKTMPASIDVTRDGLTLAGWAMGKAGKPGGVIFGFGNAAWNTPSLVLKNGFGFITLTAGSAMDSYAIKYNTRVVYDDCWHHLALIISPGWSRVELFVDGSPVRDIIRLRTPTGGQYNEDGTPTLLTTAGLNGHSKIYNGATGSGFQINTDSDGFQLVDEVNVWGRALTQHEVVILAASTAVASKSTCPTDDSGGGGSGGGSAVRCDHSKLTGGHNLPFDLSIRYLTASTLVIVTDPTEYLHAEIHAACGASLVQTEAAYRVNEPLAWRLNYEYKYAAMEIVDLLRPPIFAKVSESSHFAITKDSAPLVPGAVHLWPNAARELRVARAKAGGGFDYKTGGVEMTATAEVQYFSYVVLDAPLQAARSVPPGGDYCNDRVSGAAPPAALSVSDGFGNAAASAFDDCGSVSFALKVDQSGYLPGAPKFGYFGSWLGGGGGALDVARWVGAPFYVRRYNGSATEAIAAAAAARGQLVAGPSTSVFEGVITFRSNDVVHQGVPLFGETILDLDFSAFRPRDDEGPADAAHYRLQVPGVGLSWPFDIGKQAVGNAFYLHARGLYHQRCGTNLTADVTAWARGDSHVTHRGGFPPEDADYGDHASAGWGWREPTGAPGAVEGMAFTRVESFDAVAATAKRAGFAAGVWAPGEPEPWSEVLPAVKGGWHDAGDFDRRDFHFNAVADLVHAYLAAPKNFFDGQLDIPESGNGVPDILDEALWGVEVWRQAQDASVPNDGRVATWIEAGSHPKRRDAGRDPQPYYLGLPTRQSTLHYAAAAALLARGLLHHARGGGGGGGGEDGDERGRRASAAKAEAYLASAKRAHAFGTRTDVRVAVDLFDPHEGGLSAEQAGLPHLENASWTEPAAPSARTLLYAHAQLWLATGEAQYFNLLNTAAMDAAVRHDVSQAHWQMQQATDLLTFALNASAAGWPFGSSWGALCEAKLVEQAELWLGRIAVDPYRRAWYAPSEGYFPLQAWGASGFRPLRFLTAAWVLTRDPKYRDAAALGVNNLNGANPLGRPRTTGLGSTPMASVLHLPSSTNEGDPDKEVVPGLTLYGDFGSVAYSAAQRVYGLFEGRRSDGYPGSAVAQMPPPWNNTALASGAGAGVDAGLAAVLAELRAAVPLWRRLFLLESQNVPATEFTVPETVSEAVAVTGVLMGPGYTPAPAQRHRSARDRSQLLDGWVIQP